MEGEKKEEEAKEVPVLQVTFGWTLLANILTDILLDLLHFPSSNSSSPSSLTSPVQDLDFRDYVLPGEEAAERARLIKDLVLESDIGDLRPLKDVQ